MGGSVRSPWENQGAHLFGAHFAGHMMEKKVSGNIQYGFPKVESHLTHLITFCGKMTGFVYEERVVPQI